MQNSLTVTSFYVILYIVSSDIVTKETLLAYYSIYIFSLILSNYFKQAICANKHYKLLYYIINLHVKIMS